MQEEFDQWITDAVYALSVKDLTTFEEIYTNIWLADNVDIDRMDEIWECALDHDDVEAFEIMLKIGPWLIESEMNTGSLILDFAIRKKCSPRCVTLLYIHGATLRWVNLTCLTMCLENPDVKNFRLLLEMGANIFNREIDENNGNFCIADLLVTIRRDFRDIAIAWIVYQWCLELILVRVLGEHKIPAVISNLIESFLIPENKYEYYRLERKRRHPMTNYHLICDWSETCVTGRFNAYESQYGKNVLATLQLQIPPEQVWESSAEYSSEYRKWCALEHEHQCKLELLEYDIEQRVRNVLKHI